ncbi:MAG TPA: tRNA lysidine(34) synthetase TilS, partial [Gammaproteobacteria bacterium]|nr:tRNA lysidine(34) synthetase TilS [Gammaproteobacteria bacterium]
MNSFSVEELRQRLEAAAGGAGGAASRRYCVAFSGGLDSTVLLVAMARLGARAALGGLRAIHVHHGLHADANRWAADCEVRCRELGVPLEVVAVDARAAPGESPEARARELRYQALAARLAPGEVLLTAQHADDQLETVLIQLLRGAGPAGLAAMPADTVFGVGRHQRPLLGFTRASLEAWARAEGLAGWLEDPANRAPQLSRNHLRHEVLPAVRAHWPGAAAAVSRAARHCAEAAGLLD